MKILLLEDEKALARYMEKGLVQAGHSVQTFHDGSKGLETAASEDFDLIILDLMLPGANGFDILSNLRAFKIYTPVFIVSAISDTAQVVKGLDLGAVDYIRKPFEWDEFLARVRVIENRKKESGQGIIVIDNLSIDTASRRVTRDEKEIKLTAKEFSLLVYLARNLNRVVSKNQIMENIWDMNFDPGSNLVEVHMYQLRKKLDRQPSRPLIETVVGMGYSMKDK